jgi:hypothetical protein
MAALKVLVGWAILIGLISLPFLYAFWRSWDRPSRAALDEQDRRIEERDTRDAFIREETKLREQEHLMALAAVRERRTFAYDAPTKEGIKDVFSVLSGEKVRRTEHELTIEQIAELETIPESVSVPDIAASPEDELSKDVRVTPVPLGIELPPGVAGAQRERKESSWAADAEFDWPEWE